MAEAGAAWVQAIAAIATFGAACVAVWATFSAPKRAAEIAEELRRTNDRIDAERRSQSYILETLLRHRGNIIHGDAVNALNLIDIVFMNALDVREAYQQFWNATAEPTPWELKVERYNTIIERIIRHLGMSDHIKASDIQRSYHPVGHAKFAQVQNAEMDVRWKWYFNEDGTPKDRQSIFKAKMG
ncbi:DUF6680 family protein [Brevundimonas aurantiaca]|uniref:DUF6680 family protein n=1 Tax=Brevundimonas aurantiaca TaxID=74316 RepID=UPI001D1853F7|nr:DUF6680 family protein [Brevundimonas aurantiaca]MCC4295013.1 hypothetical protein [Brevundimonas aurantiaca]